MVLINGSSLLTKQTHLDDIRETLERMAFLRTWQQNIRVGECNGLRPRDLRCNQGILIYGPQKAQKAMLHFKVLSSLL